MSWNLHDEEFHSRDLLLPKLPSSTLQRQRTLPHSIVQPHGSGVSLLVSCASPREPGTCKWGGSNLDRVQRKQWKEGEQKQSSPRELCKCWVRERCDRGTHFIGMLSACSSVIAETRGQGGEWLAYRMPARIGAYPNAGNRWQHFPPSKKNLTWRNTPSSSSAVSGRGTAWTQAWKRSSCRNLKFLFSVLQASGMGDKRGSVPLALLTMLKVSSGRETAASEHSFPTHPLIFLDTNSQLTPWFLIQHASLWIYLGTGLWG